MTVSRIAAVMVAIAALAGCATTPPQRTALVDSPQYLYISGMIDLDNGRAAEAAQKFQRAQSLDAKLADPYAGLALALAKQHAPDKEVQEALKAAKKRTDSAEDKFTLAVAMLRVAATEKQPDWLHQAEEAYQDAIDLGITGGRQIPYYESVAAADYHMGLAYRESGDFDRAHAVFSKGLTRDPSGKWASIANRELKSTDGLSRAQLLTSAPDVARRLASNEAVSRSDLAALLFTELKLGNAPRSQDGGAPAQPIDINEHPLKSAIQTVLNWHVRGLEPTLDQASKALVFRPADPVKRKDLALVCEDLLMRMEKNDRLARSYFGQKSSPFSDVRPTDYDYNAIITVTTRGIMEGGTGGAFRPDDPASGSDALSAIYAIKLNMSALN
ncbi:S-layer homology domain-containing protein [Geomonas sp.]|uniref:S-layer homology domain-containing protein n=1 Tax=Geomonas sp. TaxID=2651584 RepID=UPI002B47B63D|nr:S-layer homology domain-containing protein [Geomonas sp.]HJV36476.1 S-layer homology domain-containing protein [Geomonas sp.]